jgi:D-alanyl-D-alanine carboxypeptidase
VTLLTLLRSRKATLGRSFLSLRRAKEALAAKRTRKPAVQVAASLPAPRASCDDLLVLVDKKTPLPKNYVPKDLVPLRSYGISTLNRDILLRQEAAQHLSRLVAAATVVGEELIVTSAYRSFQYQEVIFDHCAFIYGDDVSKMVARPGHSQHQLGTAVDFTSEAANYRLWLPFGDTSAGRWLFEHADEYGFVLAYPKGREAETGYQWEPWHYRYIGVENAWHLRVNGLSLQAFLLRRGLCP